MFDKMELIYYQFFHIQQHILEKHFYIKSPRCSVLQLNDGNELDFVKCTPVSSENCSTILTITIKFVIGRSYDMILLAEINCRKFFFYVFPY